VVGNRVETRRDKMVRRATVQLTFVLSLNASLCQPKSGQTAEGRLRPGPSNYEGVIANKALILAAWSILAEGSGAQTAGDRGRFMVPRRGYSRRGLRKILIVAASYKLLRSYAHLSERFLPSSPFQ